ncbi:TPA: hypothetical protein ACVGNN_000210 [Pseudomonas aeruginosa]
MTKANECTCPSGDGSLRHPCPAHPASVELAGVGAKLTFINGRPAMCGCQVEYSSGGGEYSDVIDVTLCAKHSGSAILDLVATNRIALTPEYEGQWHADFYLDREIPLAKAEGATPAEAVLALMSAERIDPEQESVEQAGGDERVIGWRERILAAHPNSDPGFWPDALLVEHMAAEIADLRAALAQPSPAQAEGAPVVGCLCGMPMTEGHHSPDGCCNLEEFAPNPAQAQAVQAEGFTHFPELMESVQQMDAMLKANSAQAERPEVVGVRYEDGTILSAEDCGTALEVCAKVQTPLMTVAQHERILASRWERAMDLMGEHVARISEKLTAERDAALAKCAELKAELAMANDAAAKGDAARHQCAGMEMEIKELRGAADHWEAESRALQKLRDAAMARVAELELKLDQSDYAYDNDRHHMRGMAKQAAEAIQVFTGHDSGANLAHRYGEKWWEHLDELRDALLAFAKNAPPAQAQHSVPEEFSFEYRHPNGECHTVTVSREQVINEMPDFLFEALCSKFCNCEPVGETNVVECCCDEYAEEFKLIAAAPGKEGV